MTIKDEVLKDLKNRVPLADIRRKYRSQSQLYGAFAEFFPEMEDKICEVQTVLDGLETRREEVGADVETLALEKNELSEDVEGLKEERDDLNTEVGDLRRELEKLDADVERFRGLGFTDEIVSRLDEISALDGAEVWETLGNFERRRMLAGEVGELEASKGGLMAEIKSLEGKKKEISEDVISESNSLDQLRIEVAGVKEWADVLDGFREDCFSASDMRSLRHGLRAVRVKGKPGLSISRLVEGLAQEKKLLNLGEKVDSVEKRLLFLKKEEAERKGDFEVYKQQGLEAVKEAKDKSADAIADLGACARMEICEAMKEFKGQVNSVVDQTSCLVARQAEELKAVQEMKARYEQLIQPAIALSGVLGSAEEIMRVPAPFVLSLLQNLELWFQLRLPDAVINAYIDTVSRDLQISPYICNSLKAASLVRVASEVVRREIAK